MATRESWFLRVGVLPTMDLSWLRLYVLYRSLMGLLVKTVAGMLTFLRKELSGRSHLLSIMVTWLRLQTFERLSSLPNMALLTERL